jgi:hypothetical protein
MVKTTGMRVKLKKTSEVASMMTPSEAQGCESRCALKPKLPEECVQEVIGVTQ